MDKPTSIVIVSFRRMEKIPSDLFYEETELHDAINNYMTECKLTPIFVDRNIAIFDKKCYGAFYNSSIETDWSYGFTD